MSQVFEAHTMAPVYAAEGNLVSVDAGAYSSRKPFLDALSGAWTPKMQNSAVARPCANQTGSAARSSTRLRTPRSATRTSSRSVEHRQQRRCKPVNPLVRAGGVRRSFSSHSNICARSRRRTTNPAEVIARVTP